MSGLVYIHVPKCGGTSFGSAVRMRYIYSQATISLAESYKLQQMLYPEAEGIERIIREYEIRDVLMARLLHRGVRCISAHVRYHPDLHDHAASNRAYVTLLRDPVARFVSHFDYIHRKHPKDGRAETLDAFLETKDAARLGAQYLFYFARQLPTEGRDNGQGIAAAVAHLERFSVIGDLSETMGFRKRLEKVIGTPLIVLKRNRKPRGSSAHRIDGSLRQRIEAICAPDIAIYDAAQTLRSQA